MTTRLDGDWVHLSFRNDLVAPAGAPDVGEALLATPWAPPGQFQVTTTESGAVTGTLVLPRGLTLTVSGKVSGAVAAGAGALGPCHPRWR